MLPLIAIASLHLYLLEPYTASGNSEPHAASQVPWQKHVQESDESNYQWPYHYIYILSGVYNGGEAYIQDNTFTCHPHERHSEMGRALPFDAEPTITYP